MIEPVLIDVDGLKLRGKTFTPETNQKNIAILFLHGWTGPTNENAAELLATNGFGAMTISLSGHNDSDGKLEDQTRSKSLQQVLAAYDYFRSFLPEHVRIGVAGNSYGGYLATLLSSERPLACIQMRVPANYPDDNFDNIQLGQGAENPAIMSWRQQRLDPSSTKSLRALNNFQGPVQIIEAELDDSVPHQTVQNYVEAVGDKTKLDFHFMKGWPHSLKTDPVRNKQYQTILLDWLNRQV